MNDLFQASAQGGTGTGTDYSAKDIEVLEGLEPVRRRPGMYIGGTDENALHHLASRRSSTTRWTRRWPGTRTRSKSRSRPGNWLSVRDNGRGIPVDPHPKFKPLSALEVILTTLHSGGKFGGDAYATSGGLHGVGSSVVNALSEVAWRSRWRGTACFGGRAMHARQADDEAGECRSRCRTGAARRIRFKPDPGDLRHRCSSSRAAVSAVAAPRPTCSAA